MMLKKTTNEEWIRAEHPEVAERFVEEVRRQDPKNAEAFLAAPRARWPFAAAFDWAATTEGFRYWQELSGEPFKWTDAEKKSRASWPKSWRTIDE